MTIVQTFRNDSERALALAWLSYHSGERRTEPRDPANGISAARSREIGGLIKTLAQKV